jgi:phosphatidylserine/phosphatidylglycerophosphate/cardiolipin synthase-like enzyme
VVLGNGAYAPDDPDPEAAAGDEIAQAGVIVHRRILVNGPFAHNKFLVVCDAAGDPATVWTGSTNWTETGLCTQSNNGLLVQSPDLAAIYKRYWDALAAAGSETPAGLPEAGLGGTVSVNGANATAWLTPVNELVDLEQAQALIDGAKEGILFLMFNPGPFGTLFGSIIQRTAPASTTYDENLYVHGVMNQDPGGSDHPQIPPVIFVHRGTAEPAQASAILPRHISGGFAFWMKEAYLSNVMVHSKTIVLDPFGDHPVVMTGSHNMGPKASGRNDDNLLIVEGSPGLARAYAVYIIGIYNDYRWRYYMSQSGAPTADGPPPSGPCDPAHKWDGLIRADCWQDGYLDDPAKVRELRFWVGEG